MKTETEIERLNENGYQKWQNLIEESPHGTLYHNIDWLKIAEKYTNTELLLLFASKEQKPVGGIPLFYQRKYGKLLTILMSPPYPSLTLIPNLGPVLADYEKFKQHKKESRLRDFHHTLEEYIRSEIKPDIVRIYTTTNFVDTRPFQWAGYSVTPEYTYIGSIENVETFWENMKAETRRSIKKAEKMGIEVEEDGFEGYTSLFESLVKRFREEKVSFDVSKQYLLELFQAFYPRNLRVFAARCNGEKVGIQVVTFYKDKISFWIGGVRASLKGIYPHDLLMWRIVNWAHDQGFRYCENVGANHPTISTFKARYAFDLIPYYVMTKSSFKYKLLRTLAKK